MDRQAEAGKTFQDVVQFFSAPVALVLMRLDADGRDLDAGVEELCDQLPIAGAGVEVIDEERSIRVCGPGLLRWWNKLQCP